MMVNQFKPKDSNNLLEAIFGVKNLKYDKSYFERKEDSWIEKFNVVVNDKSEEVYLIRLEQRLVLDSKTKMFFS